jgi:hypothetical protein
LTQGSGAYRGISGWSLTLTHPFLRMWPRGCGTGLMPRG